MAVYTFSEVRALINSALPKEADEDIVLRALAAELNSRIKENDHASLCNCLSLIMPVGMSVRAVTRGLLDVLNNVSLRYTRAGRLVPSLKNLIIELHASYFANIISLYDDGDWKIKHQAEINRTINEPDDGIVSDSVKSVLKRALEA